MEDEEDLHLERHTYLIEAIEIEIEEMIVESLAEQELDLTVMILFLRVVSKPKRFFKEWMSLSKHTE